MPDDGASASSTVSRPELLRLLEEWRSGEGAGQTFYLPPGGRPPARVPLPETARAVLERSETGGVLFSGPGEGRLVTPPFPVSEELTCEGWCTGPLVELLERPRRIGVLLLRLGGFAVGVYQGERLVDSKVGSRFVKGRHGKGGSSQGRFARRREEQARALYRKTCEVLAGRLQDEEARLDHVLVGGDRMTLRAFEKECPYLRRLDPIRMRRRLHVREPSRVALDTLPRQLYESGVLAFST